MLHDRSISLICVAVCAYSTGFNSVSRSVSSKEVVTLKDICAELKIDTTEARVKLRAAGKRIKHSPGKSWQWQKGSPVIKEVKAILKDEGEKS